jgi:hypothetical protein
MSHHPLAKCAIGLQLETRRIELRLHRLAMTQQSGRDRQFPESSYLVRQI